MSVSPEGKENVMEFLTEGEHFSLEGFNIEPTDRAKAFYNLANFILFQFQSSLRFKFCFRNS